MARTQPMVRIQAGSIQRFDRYLKSVAPKVEKEMRKRLREVGNESAEEIKKSLHESTPKGASFEAGDVRGQLAERTKVSLSFTARGAALSIRTRQGVNAEGHPFGIAYNAASFRVKSRSGNWREQSGRPFMGKAFNKKTNHALAVRFKTIFQTAFNDARTL